MSHSHFSWEVITILNCDDTRIHLVGMSEFLYMKCTCIFEKSGINDVIIFKNDMLYNQLYARMLCYQEFDTNATKKLNVPWNPRFWVYM